MKKIYFIFVLSLILCSCSKGKSDSELKQNVSDSISYYFAKFDRKDLSDKEKIAYLNKVSSIIKNSENSLKIRELNYDLISKYYIVESWDNYKVASQILLKNSLSANDAISLAKSYRSFGNYFYQTKEFDSSFYYYNSSEKIYKQINDFDSYSTILLKKGIIQYNANDHLGADLSLSKALGAVKKTNDYSKKYAILNQLGLNSNQLKEYNKAINYFNSAIKITQENNLENSDYLKSVCLSNIGLVYQNLKNHSTAIVYFEKSLIVNNLKQDYPEAYSNIIDNLAYSKLQENDLKDLPRLFFESLKIRESLNDNSAMVISFIHISEYYHKVNENKKALEFANQALKIARKYKSPVDILFSLKQGSVVDNDKAAQYSEDYLRITDSLQIAERNSKDRFARIQLGTQEIIEENGNLENRNRNLLYIFVITFVLVGLLFVVRAQRARTRELLYKQAQQKANEDIYNLMMSQQSIIDESRSKEKKRLAQDLHDGVLGRMFGLRLNLDSLNSSSDEEAVQKRLELLNELKTIEQDIREISHDLNREKLVLINNFVSIVHNLLEEQKTSHEANVNYTIDDTINWDKIGNAIKINMYRILQEGLQNINKYAGAKNIDVEIKGEDKNVYLKIKDDGIGFDVNKKSKGIGMQNMISRTEECRGIININSKKDHGTQIVITIPIETTQTTTKEV
ncbi:MAG TPA: sensor histidine kinase [Flavobacterium sp.]|uniref:tetratricopeptide repeat-containing sensor histidine kinase n=1 Tax=Flavobacterium sp. TaxID=239 RepID=UPI002BC8A85C|nr:sensor histidine kinase [Flavobacterium sp.]HNP32835.1 sensor histidine kinase [Flavobacterium sp.]